MKVRDKKWIRFRIHVVAIFFLCGLGIILLRAYQLQILQKEKLTSIALSGYKGLVKLPPKRGIIYDREGHELAVSIEVGSVYAHPHLVTKKSDTAKQLAETLHSDQGAILNLLKSNRPFVWIERKIPTEKIRELRSLGMEGIGFTAESRRYYPGKEIAGHVIGFAGEDNQGLEGVEKSYDRILRGPEYSLVQLRDAHGRPFYVSNPTAGGNPQHHLVLTIDKDIQYKAEQALKKAVEETQAEGGHCLVIEPNTGEVLAMAVAPLFNPNVFWKHQSGQWRNLTIADCYEPGSTMKTFLVAAALDRGVVSPDTRFYCENGQYQVGRHIIHDHDNKGHGSLAVSEIVIFSSNIGAVKIGQKLGYETYYEYLRRFGFGERTGIDLIGEREGYVRPVKEAREIDKATTYFGQGITTNSIQLVMAIAAIANGGNLMRPYLVKAVRDGQGKVMKEYHPQVVRRVISKETAKQVALILEGVVSEKGTASLAAISGYRVGGKTGTSQKVDPQTKRYSNKDYVTMFAGFVPLENPRLVMLVVVDEPKMKKYGGLIAAPVFRDVGKWSLSYLRVTPDTRTAKAEEIIPKPDVRHITSALRAEADQEAGVLPDFRGKNIREVLKGGKTLGLEIVLEGTGLAVNQSPEPGSPLNQVTQLKVLFRPPV